MGECRSTETEAASPLELDTGISEELVSISSCDKELSSCPDHRVT